MGKTYRKVGWRLCHDPSWYRRMLNKQFRCAEKQMFKKTGEIMRKTKNRGYWW